MFRALLLYLLSAAVIFFSGVGQVYAQSIVHDEVVQESITSEINGNMNQEKDHQINDALTHLNFENAFAEIEEDETEHLRKHRPVAPLTFIINPPVDLEHQSTLTYFYKNASILDAAEHTSISIQLQTFRI
ncbi:hypothetical protein GYB22_04935 [bacterium]|nr:hypothetical protein [bacterium]